MNDKVKNASENLKNTGFFCSKTLQNYPFSIVWFICIVLDDVRFNSENEYVSRGEG